MEIRLENCYLEPSIKFLNQLKLKGKKSRARTQLVKLLVEQLRVLAEAQNALVEEYGKRDEEGNFIHASEEKGGGVLIEPRKAKEYLKEHDLLMKEVAEIQGATYIDHEKDMQMILEQCELELSGIDADVYDRLLEAFESKTREEDTHDGN